MNSDEPNTCRRLSQSQEQPSTSRTCKSETPEFGYSDSLPFAPWRRKRYGLNIQGLHEEIVDMYHWIKPNEIESRLRTKVFEKVRDSVLRRWKQKTIKISMFGSLRTNLFLPTSDIDVLVECDDWVGTPGDWLAETARGLEADNIAESVMVYGGAFVPIVKMVDRDTRLSIDISFNTVQGVRAASYIAKVKEEFPLIEPLVLLLKQFLHYRNLNQTFTGGLSSYGLVLLLVNFFQLYALNMRSRTIYDRGVNLGHLLLRFLELYSLEFNFEEMGISPGQCCYIPKSASGARYGHKQAQPGNLALEDPLLTANDVGRSTYNFSSIANAFGQAFQILLVAVTLRERKGKNHVAMRAYKGSLLHLIMPFTSKELTYRNWLMSGVLSMPGQEAPASYDLNQLHNTLVSPMVDLSRYAWLRKAPAKAEKRDSRPLTIVNPADDRQTLAQQLKKQILEQTEAKKSLEKMPACDDNKKEEELVATRETDVELEAEDTESEGHHNGENDLILTGPPLPTSTQSVNTSATVSTAASISEREDTDSPGLSSSMGNQSSEEDEDNGINNRNNSAVPVQFKKPFNEVVAQPARESKRTQTTSEDKMQDQFHFNGYSYPPPSRYAAGTAAPSHKHRNAHPQRQRPSIRNLSQGSDGSDEYNVESWNNNIRQGRRASSNSPSPSRQQTNTRNCGPTNNIPYDSFRSQNKNSTLDGSNNSSEEPITMYADVVKKKSSITTSTNTSTADVNVTNGNPIPANGIIPQSMAVVNVGRGSYRNALTTSPMTPPSAHTSMQKQHHLRKDNECGFDNNSATSSTDLSHHQPQLVPPVNRLQR